MNINTAKQLVVEAGKKLVETGLIARTWGNVSCRISDTQFCITPSGRAYENLAADEIVIVNTADCSYDGDIKPSSEKGIHASVYSLKPDINFVIHTHQTCASVVSALGTDINNIGGESAAVVGDHVTVASYGLPGTGKLKKGVCGALMRSDSKAIIMAHHGALCMGKDFEEAFAVAAELEKICDLSARL
ncbi:MAG: class II aldolase/adducin family protein, partial [Oscillospiraceae bacterium]|nr:class II aldolase/adducin family protein [Oscillospiraceae bacterium]